MKLIKQLGIIGMVGLTLFATGCGCSKEEEKKTEEKEKEPVVSVNTEENVIKDQTFEGLTMTNTSLVTTDGISKLVTEVTNNTGADYYLQEFEITVKDAEGNVLDTLVGYVTSVIKNGETKTINSSTDIDLSKATSIEYNVKK